MSEIRTAGAVIAGVGHTEFSRDSGRPARQLAVEAVTAAIADAGLSLRDIDGLVTYDLDSSNPLMLAQELALGELRWFSCTPYGGGLACGTIQDAALAVDAGIARVVVAYRADNMRSGRRFGQGGFEDPHVTQFTEWSSAVGLVTPAQTFAMWAHRYLHDRGLTNEDLAPVVLASRRYAASNPLAYHYRRPYSLADHRASAWVAEPVLRVHDCCLESDGGVAVVVTRRELAGDGAGAVAIRAAARGLSQSATMMQNYYRRDIGRLPDLQVVLEQLWRQAGIRADDLDLAILYDAFSPLVFMALEEIGIVDGGDVAGFVAGGGIDLHGEFPVNPHGGQLSEAYIHGFNGLVEAVRQVRGTASNQVRTVEHVLVIGSPASASSGLVLGPVP
jgi:acetyl-CoA acetyltransferase